MRALFYHPLPTWTGGARAFAAAARGLAARGWHVTFATCADGEAHRHAEALGVPVVPVEPGDSVIGATAPLARAIREHFVEVVFVHGERAQIVAAGACWRASRGAVVRRVAPGDVLTLGRSARTALRSAATGFLCAWPEQAGTLPEGIGALGVVVADVGVAVEHDLADGIPLVARDAAAPVRSPLRRIVCVYEPGARVRAATVLRTAAMLAPRHPELRVTLVGPGSDDEGLRMHAAALGVNRVVAHLGDGADVPALVAGADLAWVVADGDEGAFGALDAMAARVPPLVDRDSVAARYVADGITGVHLPPGDTASIAAIVAQLLAREDDRAAMGGAGRARVARTFTEAAMLDGFQRVAASARDRSRWRG